MNTTRPTFDELIEIAAADQWGETARLLGELLDTGDPYTDTAIETAQQLLALHGLDTDRQDDALFLLDEITRRPQMTARQREVYEAAAHPADPFEGLAP